MPAGYAAQFPQLDPLVAQLLFNRGLLTPESVTAFFDPGARPLDPLDAPGMAGLPETVERLARAVRDGEPIAVYGDYDADGVTATALLVIALRAAGARVHAYIPDRMDEGYGLNREALRKLKESGDRVVVTVDCGVRSIDEVAYGRDLGLDMIVTDHHTVGPALPPAFAVINPKRADCPYPYKDFSGVGLAFKLAQALHHVGVVPGDPLAEVADLAALGTVADLVPLTGENRVLVRRGLEHIRRAPRPGLLALLTTAGRARDLNSRTIGYALGPRLNAAGRLESALAAYELLVTLDEDEAFRLAGSLDNTNRERQEHTRLTSARARALAMEARDDSPLIFAGSSEFLPGVIGLAAGRLTEEFYRPAVVVAIGESESRGSARSIPEFHITEALDACADLLVRYGGHAAAAGFTVRNENLPALQERLHQLAHARLSAVELVPTLVYDAEVRLISLSYDLLRTLDAFEPCGFRNPQPVFMSRGARVRSYRLVGTDGKHLKLALVDERGAAWDAIAFQQGEWAARLPAARSPQGERIDLVYTLELNEWNGEKRLQLNVQDLRPASA
jgi:single-stranded-DNA-specific exonuclease